MIESYRDRMISGQLAEATLSYFTNFLLIKPLFEPSTVKS